MQPHNRTLDIAQAPMQAVAVAQIDRGHAGAPAAVIATIVLLDLAAPQVAVLGGRVLAEADVDEEVAVGEVRLEIGRRGRRRPGLDRDRHVPRRVPAAQAACAFGFVVQRRAERDYALDLDRRGGQSQG